MELNINNFALIKKLKLTGEQLGLNLSETVETALISFINVYPATYLKEIIDKQRVIMGNQCNDIVLKAYLASRIMGKITDEDIKKDFEKMDNDPEWTTTEEELK